MYQIPRLCLPRESRLQSSIESNLKEFLTQQQQEMSRSVLSDIKVFLQDLGKSKSSSVNAPSEQVLFAPSEPVNVSQVNVVHCDVPSPAGAGVPLSVPHSVPSTSSVPPVFVPPVTVDVSTPINVVPVGVPPDNVPPINVVPVGVPPDSAPLLVIRRSSLLLIPPLLPLFSSLLGTLTPVIPGQNPFLMKVALPLMLSTRWS